MFSIHTEITIDAPFERVSDLLADTSLYRQWNPLFTTVVGVMEAGSRLSVDVALPEIKPFSVRATIREIVRGSRLCWRYGYPLPGLFSWTYAYELKAGENGQQRFTQKSSYGGILAPLYYVAMKKQLERGMLELNRSVQRWGERRGISCLKC